MDIQLINSYFQQLGFNQSLNSKLIFFKSNYEVRLLINDKMILIINKNELIYKTGMPKNEASIVKWINLLIEKHEKRNNQTDSYY